MKLKDFINYLSKYFDLIEISYVTGIQIFKGYVDELKYIDISEHLDCIVYTHNINFVDREAKVRIK